MVSGDDTLFSEDIRIFQKEHDLFYEPLVKDQNNGQPVLFRLISNVDGIFVFENAGHDFPQRIIYSNPAPDSLSAIIEGKDKGKDRIEEFRMKRVR